MGNKVMNAALGRFAEFHDNVVNNTPANSGLVVVLLRSGEADGAIVDHATLADLLAAAGNTEADFTNYARIVLTDSSLSAASINSSTNQVSCVVPDQTISNAGGTVDNTLARVVLCYDPDTTSGNDSNLIPMFVADFAYTTTGSDLVIDFPSTGYATSTSP